MYVRGEVQAAQARSSSLHRKVEPASDERKRNVVRRAVVEPGGPVVMVVFDRFRSIVQA